MVMGAAGQQCRGCGLADESWLHILLHCPRYTAQRYRLMHRLAAAAGADRLAAWQALPDQVRYQALASAGFWSTAAAGSGGSSSAEGAAVAQAHQQILQEFMLEVWHARELVLMGEQQQQQQY
jgi:hypothetical protein